MSERLKAMETALEKEHKAMDAEQKRSNLNRPREGRRGSRYVLFIFIALTMGIGASGYFYYKSQEKQLREATNDHLSTVADLKVKQIAAWRNDRIEDATIIMKQSPFVLFVHQWLVNPADSNLKEKVSAWMNIFQEDKNYKAVFLTDAQGDTRLSLSQRESQISRCIQSHFAEAARTKKIIFTDFHFVATTHNIHLALIIPLFDSNTAPFGFVVLEIDPYQFLYPLIQTWPTPSETAETLLVRREGNEVVFLNELRHRRNTALTLRLPITQKNLPAAMAGEGKTGIVEGIDYRGVPVIAVLRKIPDSPWFLVSKIDVDEANAFIKRRTQFVAIIVALLIALSGAGLGLLWRHQSAQFYGKQYTTEIERATERKQAEAALQRSEERFKMVANNLGEWIWEVDTDGLCTYASPVLEKTLGYKPEEVVGKMHFYDLFTPGKKEELKKAAFEMFARKKSFKGFVNPNLHKNGALVILETSGAPVLDQQGRLLGYCGGNIDITERKRAEEEILRQNTLLEGINKVLRDTLRLETDEEVARTCLTVAEEITGSKFGWIGEVNPSGRLDTIVMSEPGWDLCRMDGAHAQPAIRNMEIRGIWGRVLKDGKSLITNDPATHPDRAGIPSGHPVLTAFLGVPLKHENKTIGMISLANKPSGYTSVDQESIEALSIAVVEALRRKRAEGSLQRSEDEARGLAHENAVIAEIGRIISSTLNIEGVYERFAEEVKKPIPFDRIGITTIDLKCQRVTIAYGFGYDVPGRQPGDSTLLTGTISEELNRRKSGILFQTDEEEEWAVHFPSLLSTFQSGVRSMLSVPLVSKDQVIGGLHLQSLKSKAYTEADLRLADKVGNQIAGAIANAQLFAEHERLEAEKASLQSQLQQSQKMEAIGRLAGGVAHDFNNLLTVIGVQSQLVLRGLREDDPLKEKLKDIEQAADRAANLTRQLLAFSRRQILEMKVIDLNIILKDMEKMLRRVIGEDIELKTVLSDDLGMIKVDPGQMEQVIVNLAVNAKDAMPKGGKLLLETADAELDEEYVRSHVGMIPGAYIMFSITDTGIGMSKEVKEQIFDPFFTTKEKGKGTGLGLSTVYGIVKQSGGDIYVYSEPNKGTTFKIYFPRVFEPQEELKKEAGEEIPQGKETILVAEDDRMVRRLAIDILRRQGYRVLEAESGGKALLISEQYKDPIHLILTDVVMSHMSGPEFIERLKQMRKDFKVLYMTGYTDETIVQHGILEEGVNLIHKPFTIEKLARKVREIIDKN